VPEITPVRWVVTNGISEYSRSCSSRRTAPGHASRAPSQNLNARFASRFAFAQHVRRSRPRSHLSEGAFVTQFETIRGLACALLFQTCREALMRQNLALSLVVAFALGAMVYAGCSSNGDGGGGDAGAGGTAGGGGTPNGTLLGA